MVVRTANNYPHQVRNMGKSISLTLGALAHTARLEPVYGTQQSMSSLVDRAFINVCLATTLSILIDSEVCMELLTDEFLRKNSLRREWVKQMSQTWIIEGEWSQYHHLMAHRCGWGLTQRQGMWEIVSVNHEKFPTDDDARKHVLSAEGDPEHGEFTLASIAINAAMVGNVRG